MATLDLNNEQLAVVSKACELFARIHMGQLEEIAWLFSSLPEERYQELTETLKELNTLITQMPKQSHFGIRSEQVPKIAKSAYDIHQVISNYLAWKQTPQGGVGGYFDSPVQYSTIPLPRISE
ncbi:hypothetical protein NOS3756_55790 (plasmid) [Nostoc sp. NIES-3756]|uniref:hypothetical protein n=1 Tax=Nostoc sp. NIES-3756 TaxID=1751286 RepID=UPI00072077D3|nr:hypothetical protein [Nostoc sp. NIES-3756]BAT56567.1 hypothetical protein NOS3756_55790 [Nostoc sp. NIES-3756]